MNALKSSLKTIGFSDKKAAIYITLLQLGESSIIDIAKKAGLKRTTVYNILPELIADGYVQRTGRGKRHRYYVDDVRNLVRLAQDRDRLIAGLVPQLEAIHNILPSKPKISYYEGLGGMKSIYQDTLDSLHAGDELLSYTGLQDFSRLVPDDYATWYVAERVKRKIRARIIAVDSPASQEWKKRDTASLRETRLVSSRQFTFNADMEIYGHKVAILSYRENFLGVIIASRDISDMHRSAFELMWSATK